jgi:hypothetical protein
MSQSNASVIFAFAKQSGIAAALIALTVGLSAPAMAADDNGAPKWKVWNYNPSGRALNGGVPTAANPGVATFAFPVDPNTALLATDHGSYKGSLLGDLTGKTITAKVSDSGGPFTYYGQGGPGDCNPSTPASVRLFFQTNNAGGFNETHYWWSNPVSLPLNGLTTQTPMSQSLANPGGWSDFYGHFGSDPNFSAGYQDAVKNVTSIGLSFGGGCFFENGVGATNGGNFTLWSFTAN